ncbi:hypothetical protein RUND412_009086 [Rhizina undulata]
MDFMSMDCDIKPQEQRIMREIAALVGRRCFEEAMAKVPAAFSTNNTMCVDEIRKAVNIKELTSKQKLELAQKVLPHAEKLMKRKFGEDCFQEGSDVYGHYWGVMNTRGFMRLMLDIQYYAAMEKEWELAMNMTERILRLNHGDNNGVRDRVPTYLMHLGKPLEALNFALGWIDPEHPLLNKDTNCPKNGFGDLNLYPKSSFDPARRNTRQLNTYGGASMIYDCALAIFKVFGPCELATSYVRLGHSANEHILPILLSSPSKYPTKQDFSPRSMGSRPEANNYVFVSGDLWKPEEVREWLRVASKDFGKKTCDGPGCTNVEERICQFQVCSGCRKSFYCGRDCQTKDWREGGHRPKCKREQKLQERIRRAGLSLLGDI